MGVLFAWSVLRLLVANRPVWLSRVDDITVDAPVLVFAVLVSMLTGLAFGTAPALQIVRTHLVTSLKGSIRGATRGPDRRRIQRGLVTAQIALTLMLLVGAGLVMRSFLRMQRADLGFDPKGLMSFQTRLPANQYFKQVGFSNGFPQLDVSPVPAMLFDRVFQSLQQLPGVQSVAGINVPPLTGYAMQVTFAIQGRPTVSPANGSDPGAPNINFHFVTPNFFSTMRMPLIRGRDFTASDTVNVPWVAIINESMARRYWPGEDPLGQRLTLNIVPEEQPRQIVAVVGDMALSRWDQGPSPMVYIPQLQLPRPYRVPYGQNRVSMTFLLRTLQSPETLIPQLRRSVSEVDPSLPVSRVEMVQQYLGQQVEAPRYYMLVLGALGAIATILAVVGIYGVVAYSVAQRAREIAIRIALGAEGRRIVMLVVREAVLFIGLGVPIGLAGALALSGFLGTVLWGVTAHDPGTFVGVALFLPAVALCATVIPAYRVLRLDPRAVLCHE